MATTTKAGLVREFSAHFVFTANFIGISKRRLFFRLAKGLSICILVIYSIVKDSKCSGILFEFQSVCYLSLEPLFL